MADASTSPVRITADNYHQDTTHVSNSMAKVFRESSALYHARFVAKTIAAPEPTEAQLRGTLLHLRVFEPERYALTVVESKKFDRRTNKGKAEAEAFEAEHAGKTVIEADEALLVTKMATALWKHGIASRLLAKASLREHVLTWSDVLPRKCRIDALAEGVGILDLKSAKDPSPEGFARACASYGYHRQAEWYLAGAAANSLAVHRFPFLVVRNAPPFEVAVYELDAEALDLAHHQNLSTIERIAECIDTGSWEAPWQQGAHKLSLPRWASDATYQE